MKIVREKPCEVQGLWFPDHLRKNQDGTYHVHKCNASLSFPPAEIAFVKLSSAWREAIVIGPSVAQGNRKSRRFDLSLSLLARVGSERLAAVKGAPPGAAQRTLDGEDRSEIIRQEGKVQTGYTVGVRE